MPKEKKTLFFKRTHDDSSIRMYGTLEQVRRGYELYGFCYEDWLRKIRIKIDPGEIVTLGITVERRRKK